MLAELGELGTASLLVTDGQRSVFGDSTASVGYTPYGHQVKRSRQLVLGFTGVPFDAIVDGYLLGNGYRLYMPDCGRFTSPDSLSPFGRGGINAYAYCGGDPVNRVDHSGHFFKFFKSLKNFLLGEKPKQSAAPAPVEALGIYKTEEGAVSDMLSGDNKHALNVFQNNPRHANALISASKSNAAHYIYRELALEPGPTKGLSMLPLHQTMADLTAQHARGMHDPQRPEDMRDFVGETLKNEALWKVSDGSALARR